MFVKDSRSFLMWRAFFQCCWNIVSRVCFPGGVAGVFNLVQRSASHGSGAGSVRLDSGSWFGSCKMTLLPGGVPGFPALAQAWSFLACNRMTLPMRSAKKWPALPNARVGMTAGPGHFLGETKDLMKTKTAKPARNARRAAAVPALPLRVKSILMPLDFSPPSQQALDYAVALARLFQAKLTLLHVVEPVATPDFATSFPLAMENDRLMAAAKRELEKVVKTARIPRNFVEKILVRCGRSFHEIAAAARTRKVDLIVISTHGHTGLKHALLGSTTERVVRHAPCPVLVVRQR